MLVVEYSTHMVAHTHHIAIVDWLLCSSVPAAIENPAVEAASANTGMPFAENLSVKFKRVVTENKYLWLSETEMNITMHL